MEPGYQHTQRGPIWIVLGVFVAALATGATFADDLAARIAMTFMVFVFAFLALCFANLNVFDRGDHLEVRYGPLRLWGTKVRYEQIEAVEATRSRLIDGWGIHWMPGRGWTFNLWGFDCVEVTTPKGMVRIGTDDRERLAAFLVARAGLDAVKAG